MAQQFGPHTVLPSTLHTLAEAFPKRVTVVHFVPMFGANREAGVILVEVGKENVILRRG
jgi:hypothetical protein